MKRLSFILLAFVIFLSSCEEEAKVRTSGTDTIDNTTYQSTTYYVYGFSFYPEIIVLINIYNPLK